MSSKSMSLRNEIGMAVEAANASGSGTVQSAQVKPPAPLASSKASLSVKPLSPENPTPPPIDNFKAAELLELAGGNGTGTGGGISTLSMGITSLAGG